MRLVDAIAPQYTKRRLLLSVLKESRLRPSRVLRRLASINFHNARLCRQLRICCNVCGMTGSMVYDFPDVRLRREHGIGLLRETLRCKSCGCTMRHRQLAHGLLQVVSDRCGVAVSSIRELKACAGFKLRVLDTDSFSPINTLLRGVPGYVHSQYKPQVQNGQVLADGSVNLDLLQIPFPDGSFDVILTSDVMEHVEDDVKAHSEILRCLVSGGTYVFTVPYDDRFWASQKLTQSVGTAGRYFILERQVHGDPHSDAGIIAHRIYGRQLHDELSSMGYEVSFQRIWLPQAGVFDGDLFKAVRRV